MIVERKGNLGQERLFLIDGVSHKHKIYIFCRLLYQNKYKSPLEINQPSNERVTKSFKDESQFNFE